MTSKVDNACVERREHAVGENGERRTCGSATGDKVCGRRVIEGNRKTSVRLVLACITLFVVFIFFKIILSEFSQRGGGKCTCCAVDVCFSLDPPMTRRDACLRDAGMRGWQIREMEKSVNGRNDT